MSSNAVGSNVARKTRYHIEGYAALAGMKRAWKEALLPELIHSPYDPNGPGFGFDWIIKDYDEYDPKRDEPKPLPRKAREHFDLFMVNELVRGLNEAVRFSTTPDGMNGLGEEASSRLDAYIAGNPKVQDGFSSSQRQIYSRRLMQQHFDGLEKLNAIYDSVSAICSVMHSGDENSDKIIVCKKLETALNGDLHNAAAELKKACERNTARLREYQELLGPDMHPNMQKTLEGMMLTNQRIGDFALSRLTGSPVPPRQQNTVLHK